MAVDLANWMQAGYSPIGGLGHVVRTFPKLGRAIPLAYGVAGKIYTELKYGANRAIVPLTDEHYTWDVMVNDNGNRISVLLSKDRRLPFVKLTRGEYLDAVDNAITRAYALDQKNLFGPNRGTSSASPAP